MAATTVATTATTTATTTASDHPVQHLISKPSILTSHHFSPLPPSASAAAKLTQGQALLRLDRFALTSNNLSYALIGERFKYWDYFPHAADASLGRVPCWAVFTVASSAVGGLGVGTKLYGFFPISTYVVLDLAPESDGPGGRWLKETSAHRQGLRAFYNRYLVVDEAEVEGGAYAGLGVLVRPLFLSGCLLQRVTDVAGCTVLVLCASSRVSLCSAGRIKACGGARRIVGLTSPAHVEYVRGTGCYDEVLAYDDEVPGLAGGEERVVIIDFSGRRSTIKKLQEATGAERVAATLIGGAAAWKDVVGGEAQVELPVKETMFDAPSVYTAEVERVGVDQFWAELEGEFRAFLRDGALKGMRVIRREGTEKVLESWDEMLKGGVGPETALILSF